MVEAHTLPPFLGRLRFKITDPDHKTRYPKKGVGYEPGMVGVWVSACLSLRMHNAQPSSFHRHLCYLPAPAGLWSKHM